MFYIQVTLCQIVLLNLLRWPWAAYTYVQFRRPEQRSRNNDRLLAAQSEDKTSVAARFSGTIQTDPEPQPPVQWVMGLFPGGRAARIGAGHPPLSRAGVEHLTCSFLHLLFFPLVRILCALRLESKKIINMVFMWDLGNFSFFGRGDDSPTHSELCRFVSGS
jgi:hypothetical protein